MNKPLQQSILRTLHYFDIFSYPLTKEELYHFLWQPPSINYGAFLDFLDQKEISGWTEIDGYYFLSARQNNIIDRKRRLVSSETRLKKAGRAAKILRLIPFLQAIFVCNTVAAGTAENGSDIDVFVVASSKRVWIVRLLSNLILRLLGLRTYGDKTANRICLSFFVDEKHLDLSSWRAVNDDIHFAYWIYQMVPVYDPKNVYEKFLRLNQWVKPFLPHAYERHGYEYTKSISIGKSARIWRWIWETAWNGWYGDMVEKQAREWQKMRFKWNIIKKADAGQHDVVLGEGIIKLHENDTRLDRYNEWKKRLANMNI